MSSLRRAMEAAQARKVAGFGDRVSGIVVSDADICDRAIFGGFDIDYDELVATSIAVAEAYTQAAFNLGLGPLFSSVWCDGLLTGMLLASLPPTASDAGGRDATGSEGGGG